MNVDAIVTSVSQYPYRGFGGDVDFRIHNVTGPSLLTHLRQTQYNIYNTIIK